MSQMTLYVLLWFKLSGHASVFHFNSTPTIGNCHPGLTFKSALKNLVQDGFLKITKEHTDHLKHSIKLLPLVKST